MLGVNYYCWFNKIVQCKIALSTKGGQAMCIPKQIIKPISISINKLSNQDYTSENSIVSNIESNTEKSIIDLYNATPEPYVQSQFEKLLTNISNKLGLSLAIYQK